MHHTSHHAYIRHFRQIVLLADVTITASCAILDSLNTLDPNSSPIVLLKGSYFMSSTSNWSDRGQQAYWRLSDWNCEKTHLSTAQVSCALCR